jgi:alkanesulfonate monooxygenase SsuD/methylene tetrahydromethanopterin reductase-like flavin-dependent oxidoreductase (luciferase family)
MKVGIEVDWQRRRFDINRERLQLADRLGYDMVFCAEFTGSDALTPLGYVLGCTDRIGVGTRIAQNTARSAPALAMAFQTLKQMGGGREVIAGLGNSNPVATEAWHGAKWLPAGPRMRDYVAIMRKAARGEPVAHEGRAISIPYREPGEAPRHPQALASILETDPSIPIMFGGGTEYMITLASEIADGLMPNGSWSPGMMKVYRPMIEAGFARRPNPPKVEDFPIWAHVDVLVTDDVKAAMGQFKEYTARYTGGYQGEGGLSTHLQWRGYGDAVQRITELYQAGRIADAEAAVPDEYIDECWLIGPMARIVERWRSRWIDDGCNLIVRTDNWPSATPAGDEVYEPLMRALRE